MYYMMRASVPSLHRESVDSLIRRANTLGITPVINLLISETKQRHFCIL